MFRGKGWFSEILALVPVSVHCATRPAQRGSPPLPAHRVLRRPERPRHTHVPALPLPFARPPPLLPQWQQVLRPPHHGTVPAADPVCPGRPGVRAIWQRHGVLLPHRGPLPGPCSLRRACRSARLRLRCQRVGAVPRHRPCAQHDRDVDQAHVLAAHHCRGRACGVHRAGLPVIGCGDHWASGACWAHPPPSLGTPWYPYPNSFQALPLTTRPCVCVWGGGGDWEEGVVVVGLPKAFQLSREVPWQYALP